MEFENITLSDIAVSAFNAYQKTKDLVSRKKNLLTDIFKSHDIQPTSILFLGFDAWILSDWEDITLYVSLITDATEQFLIDHGVNFTRITNEIECTNFQADVVVANDEFFTYCLSDEDQIDRIELAADLTGRLLITTLRDYKNLSARDKEFSQPTAIKNDHSYSVFLEYHNYAYKVKNHWISQVYENGEFTKIYGPFHRRPMFFKQLAKFSYDAGAINFVVHRDLMYKSLFKKNYEHVISVLFE